MRHAVPRHVPSCCARVPQRTVKLSGAGSLSVFALIGQTLSQINTGPPVLCIPVSLEFIPHVINTSIYSLRFKCSEIVMTDYALADSKGNWIYE
jgi:hypothetical protein